jgi:diguanylate cyclase (GGDEF)-like protein
VRTKLNLRKANVELSVLVHELQEHDRGMRLINRMNVLLQACTTQEEAYHIIALAVGELFTDQSGGLAILNDSGQYLETFAHWGVEPLLEPTFSLHDCCAMRRVQKHEVADPQTIVTCCHFVNPQKTGYLCLPLVVQGETLGLIALEIPAGMNHKQAINWRHLVEMLGEGIKLSLFNLKQREILREQTIHDPLTGIFNRCYLQDMLPREINYTKRLNAKLCIAMLDIDHFKQFNDTFGHEAGNTILCEFGKLLHENVRESDIVCRFGGDQFVLVLLDSPLEASCLHLEKICTLFKELKIWYGNQLLRPVTLSVGLVEASRNNLNVEVILRAAEEALFAAKRAGRGRIVTFNDLVNKSEVKQVVLFQDYTRFEPNA